MEFAISAPIAMAAGAIAYGLITFLARGLPVYRVMRGSPPLIGWTIFLLGSLQGLAFYAARVAGLQLAGSLDVVRVAFGFAVWLAFCGGMAIAAFALARRRASRGVNAMPYNRADSAAEGINAK